MNTFQASCQRGHDRIEFTDRDAFERHMTGGHGAKRLYPGGPNSNYYYVPPRQAPGWNRGRFVAKEWKAPRGNAASFARIMEWAVAEGVLTVERLTEAA